MLKKTFLIMLSVFVMKKSFCSKKESDDEVYSATKIAEQLFEKHRDVINTSFRRNRSAQATKNYLDLVNSVLRSDLRIGDKVIAMRNAATGGKKTLLSQGIQFDVRAYAAKKGAQRALERRRKQIKEPAVSSKEEQNEFANPKRKKHRRNRKNSGKKRGKRRNK